MPASIHIFGRHHAHESNAALWSNVAAALLPRAPVAERYRAMRTRVLTRARAQSPPGTSTLRAHEGEWRQLAPGVSIKLLRHDARGDNMTAYVRFLPGAALDGHPHARQEECLMVEGEVFIGTHRLVAGDLHIAAAGTRHDRVYSPRGALMLVRAQLCDCG